MEGRCTGVWAALLVLAGLAAPGSSYQILEGPENATVLVGWEARFNCTVSPGWRLIMWALNGTVVLSVTPKEPIITNDRFTSASYEEGGDFVSEMIIHDVQLSDAGRVRCSLQNSDREGSAFLSVQGVGKLLMPGSSLVVTEDEPCNVTCRAVGWNPLPDLSWEIGAPVSHWSYYSVPEPDDLQSTLSVLALTPQGNGTLTCVANMKGLHIRDSVTVNLTVVPPPLDLSKFGTKLQPAPTDDDDGLVEPFIMRSTTEDSPSGLDKHGAPLPTWAIVLLAVSFSLLLILIIVLIIIFCCCCVSRKENKETSYQDELKKSAHVKTDKEASETKLKSGNENYGYSSDEPRTAKVASLSPESDESSVPEQHSRWQPQQGTDHHQLDPARRPHVTFYMASPRKVRNVTLV